MLNIDAVNGLHVPLVGLTNDHLIHSNIFECLEIVVSFEADHLTTLALLLEFHFLWYPFEKNKRKPVRHHLSSLGTCTLFAFDSLVY